MQSPPAEVPLGARRWTVDDVVALARRTAVAVVPESTRSRLATSHAFLCDLAERRVPVYGLTTGCGPLAEHAVTPAQRESFQRNLVRSHATTLGAEHPIEWTRAALAVRAQVLAQGLSGVEPRLVDLLAAMLNHGIHPIVREIGGVGASGDLVELAQIALAVLGEGEVEADGARVSAAEALRAAGLEPITPRHREGLALMNGTSFHTGAAALLVARAEQLIASAQVIAAMGLEALLGDPEALDPLAHRTRPHEGQAAVAATLSRLVAGSRLLRDDGLPAHRQDPYSLRCLPQILGPVLTTIAAVRRCVETELQSACDNPIFFAEERRVVHGGNFHGQPVALALDQLKTALIEIGVQSERRTARLLDGSLNRGLPPFLVAGSAGVESGLMGLQYAATAMAAENLVLSAPASVHSLPTNANNQDIVSMGMVAARLTRQVADNVARMLAIELLCAAQALDLRGAAAAGAGVRAAHQLLRREVPRLTADRPLTRDVDAALAMIEGSELAASARNPSPADR
jgi:histidine ammonia-lyase